MIPPRPCQHLNLLMSIDMEWTREAIAGVYHSPILDLVHRAGAVHRQHHRADEIQVCTLMSIKTGGCPENCGYCSQSAHFDTGLQREALVDLEEVAGAARKAAESGSTRFCMGAAWRQVRDDGEFEQVLEMVETVAATGMEVCCTLGMLTTEQAARLKQAGLHAYNHNLDTGPEHYDQVVSTRTYQDRLNTLANVGAAGISVCCGGILGLGESHDDRIDLLHTLANLAVPPESVPVNALVPIPGTPMGDQAPTTIWDILRMIAATRVVLPEAMVRLSAGRDRLSAAEQALCFLAGANSIFSGDQLLTTPHPGADADAELLRTLELKPLAPQPVA